MTDAERQVLNGLRMSATLNHAEINEYMRLLALEKEEASLPFVPAVEVVKPKKVYKKRK